MGRKSKGKKKGPGHFCWSCERHRPNEKFSGKNRSRHLCRDCAKLGREELEYRQARRNLARCHTWEGFIRRKARKQFERFLEHENPRIRKLAKDMQEEDRSLRAERKRERELAQEYEADLAVWEAEWEGQWGDDEESASLRDLLF